MGRRLEGGSYSSPFLILVPLWKEGEGGRKDGRRRHGGKKAEA